MRLFFTSDTHFSDPRVLRIDRRPFANLAEHDAALVANWNGIIGPDDEVWFLGDFLRGGQDRAEAMLAALNGTKHLIIGNNDPASTVAARGWSSVQHYAELSIGGTLYVLCHYPFRTWRDMGKKSVNLHGHSHGLLSRQTRQYDVGVDPWSYRPVTLDTILTQKPRKPERPERRQSGD